jgi:two-component system NtrC family response regulator
LEKKVKRAVVIAEGQWIGVEDLKLEISRAFAGLKSVRQIREEAQGYSVKKALEKHDVHISRAARVLGVSRPTFRDVMETYRVSGEK